MPGCSAIAWPTTLPRPVSAFTTPAGRWLLQTSASSRIVRGASSAAFMITVLPAASAAGILNPAIISGEFQGRMQPTTPSGSRRVYCSWLSPAGRTVPLTSPATPAK